MGNGRGACSPCFETLAALVPQHEDFAVRSIQILTPRRRSPSFETRDEGHHLTLRRRAAPSRRVGSMVLLLTRQLSNPFEVGISIRPMGLRCWCQRRGHSGRAAHQREIPMFTRTLVASALLMGFFTGSAFAGECPQGQMRADATKPST